MKKRASSKNSLFMMELILVILFFAIAAAICMQVFATAKLTSMEAKDLSRAVLAAQESAECFKAAGGAEAELADLLGTEPVDGSYFLYYDADWQRTEPEAAAFVLRLEPTAAQTAATVRVSDCADGEPIYTIPVYRTGGAL